MKTFKPWLVILAALTLPLHARAHFVTVDADLLVRPQPEWSRTPGTEIVIAPSNQLPDMQFAEPYPANWNNVQASLLDGLTVKTQPGAENEALVELEWKNPGVLIYDLVLSDGKCFGVNWRLPEGGWRVQGRIVYDPQRNAIGWGDFAFFNEAVGAPTVNLGDCNITPERMAQLTADLMNQTVDPNWMEPLVRRAILEWAEVRAGAGPGGLLDTITYNLSHCVTLTWKPLEIRELPSGMWRIPGQFILESTSHHYDFGTVDRTETEAAIDSVTDNTLILPLNAPEIVAAATARNRGFHGNVLGSTIHHFRQLFGSRKFQNFEWGDLLNFPLYTDFLFHVGVHGPVTLSDRKANGKGINFAHKSSVLVTAKSDVNGEWFPYFDFKGIEQGRVNIGVSDSVVSLNLSFHKLDLRSYLRDEFAQVRRADSFTNMDLLNKRFDKLLSQHEFSFPLPRWKAGAGHEITAEHIKEFRNSIRLPLAVRSKTPLPNGTVLRVVDGR